MVRIQDSQSWHRGSIPLSTTNQQRDSQKGSLFYLLWNKPYYLQLFKFNRLHTLKLKYFEDNLVCVGAQENNLKIIGKIFAH